MALCEQCGRNQAEEGSQLCASCRASGQSAANFFNTVRRGSSVFERYGYCVRTQIRLSENAVLYVAANDKNEQCAFRKITLSEAEKKTEAAEKEIKALIGELARINQNENNRFVITYYDYSVERGDGNAAEKYDLYIRMDYLTSLQQQYQETVMTVGDLIRMGMDVCDALEWCHKNRRIHNNLNPNTIYLNHSGTYVLGDFALFGIVCNRDVWYMAPELKTGGRSPRPSSDIYSLGMVLYVLLNNGRKPEENTNRRRGFHGEYPGWINRRLRDIVERALAPERKRYKDVESMRHDLKTLLENMTANTPEFLERPLKFSAEEAESSMEDEKEASDIPLVPGKPQKSLREELKRKNLRDICLLTGILAVTLAGLGLGVRYLYESNHYEVRSLIEADSYAAAYAKIETMWKDGRNVDDLAREYIDACMADREYKRVVSAAELFSEEGYSDTVYFENLIVTMRESGKTLQADTMYRKLYSVETLRPMLEALDSGG